MLHTKKIVTTRYVTIDKKCEKTGLKFEGMQKKDRYKILDSGQILEHKLFQ